MIITIPPKERGIYASFLKTLLINNRTPFTHSLIPTEKAFYTTDSHWFLYVDSRCGVCGIALLDKIFFSHNNQSEWECSNIFFDLSLAHHGIYPNFIHFFTELKQKLLEFCCSEKIQKLHISTDFSNLQDMALSGWDLNYKQLPASSTILQGWMDIDIEDLDSAEETSHHADIASLKESIC